MPPDYGENVKAKGEVMIHEIFVYFLHGILAYSMQPAQ